MMQRVEIPAGPSVEAYDAYASLMMALRHFETSAGVALPYLKGTRLWMINSTSQGGGVAEMLPPIINLARQFDVDIEWAVINTQEEAFFALTKQLHNLIHGKGDPHLDDTDRELFERVNEENAASFVDQLGDDDIIVVHDPQPMPLVRYWKQRKPNLRTVWRCHIGLDTDNAQTDAAWEFLRPYFADYDHLVFSAPEYIPAFVSGNVSVIPPGIDPLGPKNKDLTIHQITGILKNAGLIPDGHPVVTEPFVAQARRVQPDGSYGSPLLPDDPGLLHRPSITQVSRWDRLKGFVPLMQGFAHLKANLDTFAAGDDAHRRRLEALRLVLVGPDPAFVHDDPEGQAVLQELKDFYATLPAHVQPDVAMLLLPMESKEENALIVNALQRCSSVVAQNSLQEGFGLTATEAMWKQKPVMGTRACGLRKQIRPDIDGVMVQNAEDAAELAEKMSYAMRDTERRNRWGHSAQKRVIDEFLIFSQLEKWMEVLIRLGSLERSTADA